MTYVVYLSAEGFFLADIERVAQSAQGHITSAALEQRESGFYATQDAAERERPYYEARRYVDQAYEAEGEQRAEYGSGAVSLGYDGGEAMLHYDGYRASEDEMFVAARALLRDRYEVVRVIQWAPARTTNDTEEIPF